MRNLKRDKNIYELYTKDKKSVEEIAKIYSLKPSTIEKIIKRISIKVDERDEFIKCLCAYAKGYKNKSFATLLRNSLLRLCDSVYMIYTIDDLINHLRHYHVRNIGEQSLKVIEDFYPQYMKEYNK